MCSFLNAFRIAPLAFVLLLLLPASGRAEDTLILGKKLVDAELAAPRIAVAGIDDNFVVAHGYAGKFTIALKAKTDVTIVSSVFGKDRHVALLLQDPDGVKLGHKALTASSVTLKGEQLSVTGKYTITVMSDRIGLFDILAFDPAEVDPDVRKLEEEIASLQKLLSDAQARMTQLKAKKAKN